MKENRVKLIIDIALFSALGLIFDILQGVICDLFPIWVNGGSVGIAMCCIFVLSYKYGLVGMLAGLLTGTLSMLRGVYISPLASQGGFFSTVLQLGLDYFLGWTLVGLAGIFSHLYQNSQKKNMKTLWIIVGCTIGGLGKYLCHFLAGILYWPSDDKLENVLYSILYNGSYMIPSIILCDILMIIIAYKQPKILLKESLR